MQAWLTGYTTSVTFMVTRVTEPNEGDWKKFVKMMNYLKATKDEFPSMSANDTSTIKWHVDASFTIHKDMKSHTSATMTLASGTICFISTKQKL
jgi:hypothetical protein